MQAIRPKGIHSFQPFLFLLEIICTWVAFTVTGDRSVIWARSVAEGHVLVYDPALARVCVDVLGS